MLWLIKIKGLSMKKAAVLGIILAIVISGSVFADCDKDHAYSKIYKYIPGLMDLHFSDLDTDGDGQISMEEFSSRFTTSGEASFKRLDRDSSLGLDRGEWNAFKVMHTGMGSHHGNHRGNKSGNYHLQERPEPSAHNTHFGDMDSNDDGVMDTKEFNMHFSGHKNNDDVFKAVDLNSDSQIDHDEWQAFKKANNLGLKE